MVAVTFFGFLLWLMQQSRLEQEKLLNENALARLLNQWEKINIKVEKPTSNQVAANPIEISGQAKTETGTLEIKIQDLNNLTLASILTQTAQKQKMSPFSAKIKYKKPTSSKGIIEITESVRGNASINFKKVRIPIIFKK